ncbi:MAG: chemotaxis protein CheW [Desulfovibrionaceae bacterium]|nr:chemotaxis protein CheW [Desulfovibrionaceae bacterium]
MKKTPEKYFEEQVAVPDQAPDPRDLTAAEQAFLDKYVGLDQEKVLAGVRRVDPKAEQSLRFSGPAEVPEETEDREGMDDSVRSADDLQFITFSLGNREFAVPISVVQEVIRLVEPAKLPTASPLIAGVIDLRGRMTPLIRLRLLFGLGSDVAGKPRFIVVCRYRGLQVGLLIHSAAAMHRAEAKDIDWNISAHLGDAAELLLALMKVDDKLISILSIEKLVEGMLSQQGGIYG